METQVACRPFACRPSTAHNLIKILLFEEDQGLSFSFLFFSLLTVDVLIVLLGLEKKGERHKGGAVTQSAGISLVAVSAPPEAS